jgi:hypothetical protein
MLVGHLVRYLLMVGESCPKCLCCEEWLTGLISLYGGRQIVSPKYSKDEDTLERIYTAKACCPFDCLIFKVLK